VTEPALLNWVVLGDIMTDVVCLLRRPLVPGSDSPAPVRVTGGGSAANTAAWLAAAGEERVRFVGRVGADLAGEAALAELRRGGVEVNAAVDADLATGTCVVLVSVDGERSMIPDPGANGTWSPQDVPLDGWGPTTHLHVSGYALVNAGAREAALEAVRLAQAAGATVSVDTASAGPLARAGAARFLSWVSGVDLALANADEAAVLGGCAQSVEAALALTKVFATVVVKLGAGGALLARRGSVDVVRREAPSVKVVDSTGAGDAFAAGFLPVWRLGGRDEQALDAGNALGARAVSRVGARP
jgi:sugar/nucleoside kinase (ribokinase family)